MLLKFFAVSILVVISISVDIPTLYNNTRKFISAERKAHLKFFIGASLLKRSGSIVFETKSYLESFP